MSEYDIIFDCKECSWSYSLQRNKVCPMCQTPPEINEALVIETIQEYSRRKGIFIKKKEGKSLASSFKKKYKRLPTFKEIWTLADKIVGQKAGGGKVSLEAKVAKKMAEMKVAADDKQQRKKELAVKRAGIEKVEKVEKVEPSIVVKSRCGKCGATNPSNSNFCLDCGTKLK